MYFVYYAHFSYIVKNGCGLSIYLKKQSKQSIILKLHFVMVYVCVAEEKDSFEQEWQQRANGPSRHRSVGGAGHRARHQAAITDGRRARPPRGRTS